MGLNKKNCGWPLPICQISVDWLPWKRNRNDRVRPPDPVGQRQWRVRGGGLLRAVAPVEELTATVAATARTPWQRLPTTLHKQSNRALHPASSHKVPANDLTPDLPNSLPPPPALIHRVVPSQTPLILSFFLQTSIVLHMWSHTLCIFVRPSMAGYLHPALLRRVQLEPPVCLPPPKMAPKESKPFGHKNSVSTPPSHKDCTLQLVPTSLSLEWPLARGGPLRCQISTSAEVPGARGQIQTTSTTQRLSHRCRHRAELCALALSSAPLTALRLKYPLGL